MGTGDSPVIGSRSELHRRGLGTGGRHSSDCGQQSAWLLSSDQARVKCLCVI